ncbi:MAG: aquaporin Z [bacterium]|jgi:aquaporin Z
MEASIGKRCVAEMLGTLTLVFIGCGSAVIAGEYIGFAGISLAFGLSVLAMVYAVGPISGCHINPAISIGMLAAGKMKARDAVLYIIMQCIGGIIAAGILLAIASGRAGYSLAVGGLGQNGYGIHSPAGYALGACFIAEIVLTAIFLLVVFGSTSEKAPKGFAGVAIGFALAFIHLVGIPVTGTSVNPARSLGPAVFAGGAAVSQVWLFFVAPIIGALIAAMIWKYALARD